MSKSCWMQYSCVKLHTTDFYHSLPQYSIIYSIIIRDQYRINIVMRNASSYIWWRARPRIWNNLLGTFKMLSHFTIQEELKLRVHLITRLQSKTENFLVTLHMSGNFVKAHPDIQPTPLVCLLGTSKTSKDISLIFCKLKILRKLFQFRCYWKLWK